MATTQITIVTECINSSPNGDMQIFDFSRHTPTRVISAVANGISATDLPRYTSDTTNSNRMGGFLITFPRYPGTWKTTVVLEVSTDSAGYFLSSPDLITTFSLTTSEGAALSASTYTSALSYLAPRINFSKLVSPQTSSATTYGGFSINGTNQKGLLYSTAASTSYPWVGQIASSYYKANGSSPTFVAQGTLPFATSNTTISDGTCGTGGQNYLIIRENAGLYIYSCTWTSDGSTGTDSFTNLSLKKSYAASTFPGGVTPLRFFIAATGGGAGGKNGGMYYGDRGGGGGGTAFAIWDCYVAPTLLVTVGAGGGSGSNGGNTVVQTITRQFTAGTASKGCYYSERWSDMIIGYGGSGQNGGSFKNRTDGKGFFYPSTKGVAGGKAGSAGSAGSGCSTNFAINKLCNVNQSRSGGSKGGSNNPGGGGGASWQGNGGAGSSGGYNASNGNVGSGGGGAGMAGTGSARGGSGGAGVFAIYY